MKDQELRYVVAEAPQDAAVTLTPDAEVRVRGGRLEGYALVYDVLSRNLGGFVERVAPGAVELAKDVLATFNHRIEALLGRSGSGTLELTLDKHGLRYAIDLPRTSTGDDVRELVRRRDVRGSSFTFRTLEDKWENLERGQRLRTLKRIKVAELGPVTLPAYPDTTVAVRSMRGGASSASVGPFNRDHAERLEALERRFREGEQ